MLGQQGIVAGEATPSPDGPSLVMRFSACYLTEAFWDVPWRIEREGERGVVTEWERLTGVGRSDGMCSVFRIVIPCTKYDVSYDTDNHEIRLSHQFCRLYFPYRK